MSNEVKEHENDYFTIETYADSVGNLKYYARSTFNEWESVRVFCKEDAIHLGEKHAKVIEKFFNACASSG